MPWHVLLVRVMRVFLKGNVRGRVSPQSRDSYIGLQGQLTLRINGDGFGQVTFRDRCTPPNLVQKPAKSMDGTSMPRGTHVLIIDVTDTHTLVVIDPTEEVIEWPL